MQFRNLFTACAFALLVCLFPRALAKENEAPTLVVDQETFDFGKVAEAAKVSHKFKVTNAGEGTLVIRGVRTDCECTTATIAKHKLRPGEKTSLQVVMDTTMKMQDTEKNIEITSNDAKRPIVTIKINAVVDAHKGLVAGGKAKIFSGKCARCHVEQGKGMMGDDLFFADCAMCHQLEPQKHKTIGGPLAPRDYTDPAIAQRVKRATCYGTASGAMPGFLDKAGGPLTEVQIDSIIHYLKTLSLERQSKVPAGKQESPAQSK